MPAKKEEKPKKEVKAKKAKPIKAKTEKKETKKTVNKETVTPELKAEKPVKRETKKKSKESELAGLNIKEEEMLVPSDDYLSAGVHIGSKQKSVFMKEYVFKIRPDGLAIMNIQKIDERLRMIINYLNKFKPEEVLFVCKRENGEKPLKMLAHTIGFKVITGRYLPGALTNPKYADFMEPKVVFVTDLWYDKQALIGGFKSGATVIGLANTSSSFNKVDIILPCNNKGHKSLGLIYWIIAREYAKAHGIPFDYTKERFI